LRVKVYQIFYERDKSYEVTISPTVVFMAGAVRYQTFAKHIFHQISLSKIKKFSIFLEFKVLDLVVTRMQMPSHSRSSLGTKGIVFGPRQASWRGPVYTLIISPSTLCGQPPGFPMTAFRERGSSPHWTIQRFCTQRKKGVGKSYPHSTK
jgi:hypothetical protein